MRIETADLEIQREPFARPFGFKGSYFHEKWNAVVRLTDADGVVAFGVGGLAVLWSDAAVFEAHTEVGGNILSLSILEHALQLSRGRDYADPIHLLHDLLPQAHDYGKAVTQNPNLKPTFTLISLVALDNAAWVLHAREEGIGAFDDLIPETFRPCMNHRQQYLAAVPVIPYKFPQDAIMRILNDGAYFLKIKIGQPGSEAEMLEKDVARLAEIHEFAKDHATDMTECGRPIYYLDANGRYREKESVRRLLDRADRIGMLDRIALFEEPFAEDLDMEVGDLPSRVAADESVHGIEDVRRRAGQGYTALAIKPAGKTLSMGFQFARAAADLGLPCYVADNACVPILVDWNKTFAGRLPSFPGLMGGVLESNGPDSYPNWEAQLKTHPCAGASWLKPVRGSFELSDDFYEASGGVFADPTPFPSLFTQSPCSG
ncbi:MAG: mandelate racemase/muconate lactonizing enzyme family protein [Planctomycetes bacterium]|nr:mandelate racemase/muconate lactonizing enzyme family protein [Planctomycetota bacterium]